jgi:chromosome segregation ATPase
VNEDATLARIDEGMRHALATLEDIKKQIGDLARDHRDLTSRVVTVESDLGHLRGDLEKEQARARENARETATRLSAVESKILVWTGAAGVIGAAGSFLLHYLTK